MIQVIFQAHIDPHIVNRILISNYKSNKSNKDENNMVEDKKYLVVEGGIKVMLHNSNKPAGNAYN